MLVAPANALVRGASRLVDAMFTPSAEAVLWGVGATTNGLEPVAATAGPLAPLAITTAVLAACAAYVALDSERGGQQ